MPRRFNYTDRKKINRDDIKVRLVQTGQELRFDADLRLAGYGFEAISPSPQVFVEAYRGASALWKRFDFGQIDTMMAPQDRSLVEFGAPEGILFRVKVSSRSGAALGRLVGEADLIRPSLPDRQDSGVNPLIQHMPADDIGDEIWRVDFDQGLLPLLKVNSRVPMGVDQFLVDPQFRPVFAPAVMRLVLTRVLLVDRDAHDELDSSSWQMRWISFASRLSGVEQLPGDGSDSDLEDWIDSAVEAFAQQSGLFEIFKSAAMVES